MLDTFIILAFCAVVAGLFGLSWLLVEGASRLELRRNQRAMRNTLRRLSRQASTRYYPQ